MQAPGDLEEEHRAVSNMGGWVALILTMLVVRSWKTDKPADLLLGRKHLRFLPPLPEHADFCQVSMMSKIRHVQDPEKSDPIAIGWKNSVFLKKLTDIEKAQNFKRF